MPKKKDEYTQALISAVAEFRKKTLGLGAGTGIPKTTLSRARTRAIEAYIDALGLNAKPDQPLWKTHRKPGEEIGDFIFRVHGKTKDLTLQKLRDIDPSAVARLYRWRRENYDAWPAVLDGLLPLARPNAGKIVRTTKPTPKLVTR